MRRFLWLLLPISFILVVLIAVWLRPDPSGIGTHQALGLPSCFFYHFTGHICPSCGLTTSFTQIVHFHWVKAFQAHPLGPPLFIMYAFASWLSLLEFFDRKTPLSSFLNGHHSDWVYGSLALYLGTWISRLVWGLAHGH